MSLLAGLTAAGVQLGVGELAATLLPGARSPLTGMGRALIDLTPGPLVDVTVGLVEGKDKPLLMGNLFANSLGVGAVAGELWDARRRTAAGLLAGYGLLGGAAAASRPEANGLASLTAGALGAGAGSVTLRALARNPRTLAIAAAVGAGALTGGLALRRTKATTMALERRRAAHALSAAADPLPASPPEPGFDEIEGLSPLYTPNVDFYETDVTPPAPALDSQDWRLRVDGLVAAPVELTYGQGSTWPGRGGRHAGLRPQSGRGRPGERGARHGAAGARRRRGDVGPGADGNADVGLQRDAGAAGKV